MSDAKVNGSAPKLTQAQLLQVAATSAVGGQANLLLAFGVPLPDTINILCEVVANLIASLEPRETRERVVNEIRRNLPSVVERQYDARHMRPSGLVVPGAPQ